MFSSNTFQNKERHAGERLKEDIDIPREEEMEDYKILNDR